jgi:iron-sulfur cluster assembly protein
MTVSMTEKAAKRVQAFIDKRGKGVGLRLAVEGSGCSGMSYKMEFVDETQPEDLVFECFGVNLIVDPKSLVYIDGTELDYAREGLQEGFKFNNPNAKEQCGCGESFSI